jgi:hypothetical protein
VQVDKGDVLTLSQHTLLFLWLIPNGQGRFVAGGRGFPIKGDAIGFSAWRKVTNALGDKARHAEILPRLATLAGGCRG